MKYKPDPAAVQLNNEAMNLTVYNDRPDSVKKIIFLLDKATAIDSNYFIGYWNKIIYLKKLKQFDKALIANKRLIELQPTDYYSLMDGGLLYQYLGDTVSAKSYFEKSMKLCNQILDTMNRENRDYLLVATSQAINLIMLNDSTKSNKLLEDLYKSQPSDPEWGDTNRKYIQSFMNKSKFILLDSIINPEKYSR